MSVGMSGWAWSMPRSASDKRDVTEMQSSGSRDGETMGHPTKTRITHTKGDPRVRMEDWFRRTRGSGSVTSGISTRLSRSRARVTAEEHHQCSLRPKCILPDTPRTSGQNLVSCVSVSQSSHRVQGTHARSLGPPPRTSIRQLRQHSASSTHTQ